MADFNAAGRKAIFLRHGCPITLLVQVFGRGIRRRPLRDNARDLGVIGEVDVGRRYWEIEEVALAEYFALPRRGQDNELVAEVAPERACIRTHRNGLQAKPRKGAQVGN